MVFFEAERMRRWPSYDALKTRLNANIYKNNNNESTATQTPPPTQPLTNEISKISLCISRAALIFLQTRQPLTTTQTQTKYQQCWQCAGKKGIQVKRPRRTLKVTFYPFEQLCQLKRLCEQNLWPVANDCYGKTVAWVSKALATPCRRLSKYRGRV